MFIDLRGLGIVSMVVIVATSALPLFGLTLDWQDSVSHAWVGSRRRWLWMATLFSLAGTNLCVSLAFWVVPHYQLPAFMYGIICLAWIAFMGVAWIPMRNRPGEHSYSNGHFIGGAVLATAAIFAMATVAWFGQSVSGPARLACYLAMAFALVWPLLFTSLLKRYFLALESLIAVAFSIAIVLLLTT
ncbi:hypothetical protein JNM87_06775 [Candidatus Saccharibacteria bacterium]|nr:hypothetical protein [Candidatus Saccharibacteria bacterium]